MTRTRRLILLAWLGLGGLGLIHAWGDPPADPCKRSVRHRVELVTDERPSDYERKSLQEAGVLVIYRPTPTLSQLKCQLDAGKDVTVEFQRFSSSELRSLGRRRGRARVAVRNDQSRSSLTALLRAGLDLEFHDQVSAYDLRSLCETVDRGSVRVVVHAASSYSSYDLRNLLEIDQRVELSIQTDTLSSYDLKTLGKHAASAAR